MPWDWVGYSLSISRRNPSVVGAFECKGIFAAFFALCHWSDNDSFERLEQHWFWDSWPRQVQTCLLPKYLKVGTFVQRQYKVIQVSSIFYSFNEDIHASKKESRNTNYSKLGHYTQLVLLLLLLKVWWQYFCTFNQVIFQMHGFYL